MIYMENFGAFVSTGIKPLTSRTAEDLRELHLAIDALTCHVRGNSEDTISGAVFRSISNC